MHSAYLLTEQGWRITENVDEALAHVGELVLNETKEEAQDNLAMLGARENGFAVQHGNTIRITERPVFGSTNDEALAELNAHGFVLVSYYEGFREALIPGEKKGESKKVWTPYEAEGYNEESTVAYQKRYEKWKGCVGTHNSGEGYYSVYRVTRDPVSFAAAQAVHAAADRAEKLRRANAPVCKWDLETTADKLSRALGCGTTRGFRLWHFWTWVAAHDQAFGKRATNKEIQKLAKQWCKNRKAHRAWMGKWCEANVVRRADERLAACCRLSKTETPAPQTENQTTQTTEPALAS